MLREFELPERHWDEEPYVLHVWGPGVARRKALPDEKFPTVVLRVYPDDSHFLLLEGVTIRGGNAILAWAENNNTARVYTRAALRCFYDDRCRCFGGQVFCDETPKETVIAHALKETSSCI